MAIKNTSVALGEPFIQFARRKVESGEFATTSEVVREAMRRYIADDMKLQALRAAIQEGIDSGPPEPFDFDQFLTEMRANYKGAA
ncbi:MAG: type II toxin-antitoxin system ParD family antitoxin [Sphingopyxis solisilvae]|uniref:type II toxin-antitoxin system ParD family antitoxin n=1 Tax=Sphingopyxis solisilvae TaxID=1886788 RepID=UPI0040364599